MGSTFGMLSTIKYFVNKLCFGKERKVTILKEIIAYLYVIYVRRIIKKRCNVYNFKDSNLYANGMKIPKEEWTLEFPREQIDFSHNTDTVQFYGVNSQNECCFIRLSRTSIDNVRIWLHLRLSDGTHYSFPIKQDVKVSRASGHCFSGGGLRIQCLLPMRRWRISFNGLLKQESKNGSDVIHVRFVFHWVPSSVVHDFWSDISANALAKFLANQSWRLWCFPNIYNILSYIDSYEQSGNLMGTISIDAKETELNLWGSRKRSVELHDLNSPTHFLDFYAYTKSGESFHVGYLHFPRTDFVLKYGYLLHSNGLYHVIEDYETSVPRFNEAEFAIAVQGVKFIFKERMKKKQMKYGLPNDSTKFSDSTNPKNMAVVYYSPVLLDDDMGYGIIISEYRSDVKIKMTVCDMRKKRTVSTDALVVSAQEIDGNDVSIAGGKAASLGELLILEKRGLGFSVPKTLVVTTAAYSLFLRESNVIRNNISVLEDVSRGKVSGDLENICKSVVSAIEKEKLPNEIKSELKKKLQKEFPKPLQYVKFAIRSSASGEDSEDLSAAGQMKTFLGVQSFDQITKAIVKCWASQFSYIAVQYKRQNGQILNSPMAVVVQEMVAADVAGVLFTCDPVTGNPQTMTITANYGIGESVVSGLVEPDIITMKRGITGRVNLKSKQLGQKKTKIVMSDDGMEEKELLPTDSEQCCVTEAKAISLAEVALTVEKVYGCALDIEWAMEDEKLYFLQARPITYIDMETEREICHGSDTFLLTEDECLTTANVGEVFPGATSSLTLAFMMKMWISSNARFTEKNPNLNFVDPYCARTVNIRSRHVFINVLNSIMRFATEKSSVITDGFIIALFGRLLEDCDLYKKATKRILNYPNTWKSNPLLQGYFLLKDMILAERNITKVEELCKNYHIKLDHCHDSKQMIDEILKNFVAGGLLSEVNARHIEATIGTSILNVILLYMLRSASESWNVNVFSDFSTLMSQCRHVISADVPSSIQRLSLIIAKKIEPSLFSSMNPEEAFTWLMNSAVNKEFKEFLDIHGHRCYKEFDLQIKPWAMDPISLVKILQNVVGRVMASNERESKTNSLKTKLSWKHKLMLRITLPFARKAVGQRERSKSALIKMMYIFREAFEKLSKKLVEEGRLPDEDLIFFLDVDELNYLIETRLPRLVQTAIRRRAVHCQLDKLIFPEIMKGVPKPINKEDDGEQNNEPSLIMKGIPVSQGTAKGQARVLTSLEDAKTIQKGDILVAYSTDIGWSPYFPLLAGVCTELGGLISHGAVVAREYGLPCVAGVHGATSKFKSGDIVFLDGNKGVLQRIK